METFHVPLTAVVTIFIGCAVLTVALGDLEFWEKSVFLKADVKKPAYTTQSERLVNRYIQNEDYTFEELLDDMRLYFGDRAEEMIAKETGNVSTGDFSGHKLTKARRLRDLAGKAVAKKKKEALDKP